LQYIQILRFFRIQIVYNHGNQSGLDTIVYFIYTIWEKRLWMVNGEGSEWDMISVWDMISGWNFPTSSSSSLSLSHFLQCDFKITTPVLTKMPSLYHGTAYPLPTTALYTMNMRTWVWYGGGYYIIWVGVLWGDTP